MKVIFNADDIGLSRGVNLGIIDACERGVVRSATMILGLDREAEDHAAKLIRQCPELKVGLHLRLTTGKPVADDVDSLLDETGSFRHRRIMFNDEQMDAEAVERECRAQLQRFLEYGLPLSHIDSHHHAHKHPVIAAVVKKLAEEMNVPYRSLDEGSLFGCQSFHCTTAFYGDDLSEDGLIGLLESHRDDFDVVEVMCHPAYLDQALLEATAYSQERVKELDILTSPNLRSRLEAMGIEVTDYQNAF